MSKTEIGVMVMKNGKGWGITYEDGQSTTYGWIPPEDAPIHNPQFCKSTTDVTYEGGYLIEELKKGKLIAVERITTVEIIGA
jgi:hypothetical protein